jgi:hypothetical protein
MIHAEKENRAKGLNRKRVAGPEGKRGPMENEEGKRAIS